MLDGLTQPTMAQPNESIESLSSWNPAARPENNTEEVRVTTTETASLEPLVSSSAQDPSKSDVKSPLSEDDFSAWDMPEDVPAPEPQAESLDSVLADTTPTLNPSGDNLQKEGTEPVNEQEETPIPIPPSEPSQELATNDIASEQPDFNPPEPQSETSPADAIFTSTDDSVDFSQLLSNDAQPEKTVDFSTTTEPQGESSADAIFASTEESVDFSQLLSNGEQQEEVVDDLVAPVEEKAAEPVPEAQTIPAEAPSIPSHENPDDDVEPPAPSMPTEPAQTSSIDAVFGSSEETDDFSALLSSNAEPAEPTDTQVPFPGAVEQPTEELVNSHPTPPDGEPNGAAVEPNNVLDLSATQESFDSTAQPVPSFEDKLAATTVDDGAWGNQDFDSDGDDFFNQLKTQTKPIFAPPEADSRFEEGVPLLDEGSDSADVETNDPFQDEDAQGFPSPPKQPETRPESSFHITRKSTSQVMESAVFPDLDSPKSDGSAAAHFDDVINAAARNEKSEAESGVSAPFEDDLDARWEAELGEKLSPAEEEDLNARWEGLQLSDDDEDDEMAVPQQTVPQSPLVSGNVAGSVTLNSPFETPQQRQTPPRPIPGVYAPHQPTTGDLVGGIGFPGAPPSTAAMPPYYNQPPPNPVTTRGESFAERSKEGYKSPYDLPDDLSKPRRPIMTHRPAPPKVDNSMPPPPLPVGGRTQPAAPVPAPVAPPPAPKNFYEELPMPAPRSRPASSGRYTPGPVGGAAAPPLASPPKNPYAPGPPTAPAPAPVNEGLPSAGPLPVQSTLQPPELLDPYAPSGTLASSAPAGPSAASRYSPRPPNLQPSAKPPARYSPAPPPSNSAARNRYASQPLNVPGQAANLPFQPRTSSPLAYHEKVSYQPDEGQQQQQPPQMPPPSLQPSVDFAPPRQRPSVDQGSPYAPQLNNGPHYGLDAATGSPPAAPQQTPPNPRYAPQEYLNEFTKRMAPNEYAPAPPAPAVAGTQDSQPDDSGMISPRRSQTQSPGQQLPGPPAYVPSIETFQRPASVHGSTSPTKTVNPYAPQQQAVSRARAVSRVTQQLEFIEPTDGQEQDPLQRWKGAPIFKFGFGGSVVSCFPRHIPRYSAGNPAPKIMPTLGEPKYSQVDSWLPSSDGIVPHPGPLKAKSKKKDVVSWLSSKIVAFENEATPGFDYSHPDAQKRHDEKILLWKITKILVENDGTLEGSPEIQKSLRQAIFPNIPEPQPEGSLGAHAGLQPLNLPSKADAVDQEWSEELRTNLRLGEREKAVWGAVDRRLWGHAMIIASTMEKSIWKQVVQEYVRREIRSTAGGTESIAALYEIFAGNVEESIDELVPPSARAGHHLISKADGQGSNRNALDGLESWKDTLGLVLSNRSADDHQALLALGHLLASYGRVEAAHICFIFSRGTVFGGADDPQANIVLLGADHQRFPCTLLNEDSILLTEVYEFATSVLANSPVANLPHLLAFKLVYAKCLADKGRKTESQAYCDSLAASLKATTRPSPYYHQHLFNEIEELSARLRQTASDGASSWISKPSMEKVSGSMWARFNSFVAGDDSDAASTGSGKAADAADVGPFAHVAGTPTVSRSPSVSDLYSSYPGAGAQPIPSGAPSRYLPNQYAPNASPEQFRNRSSMDSQRSFSGGMSFGQRRPSQEPETPVDYGFPGAPMYASPGSVSYQPTPPQSSYAPLAPVKEDASQSPAPELTQPAVNGLFYQPPGQENEAAGQSPFYQGPPGMPQAESSGYMPPETSNSYEPPSFTPAVNITPDEEDQDPKPSMVDDDDDLTARAEQLKRQENDRKADEAFRKAAEEDGKFIPTHSSHVTVCCSFDSNLFCS